MVDILDIVERVVEMEGQFGNLAQLEAHFLAEFIADCAGTPVYVLKYLFSLVAGEIER